MTMVDNEAAILGQLDRQFVNEDLRARYFDNVHGPLTEAVGSYENAYHYLPYLNKEEPRRIMAHIAMKLPINNLGEHRGDEA